MANESPTTQEDIKRVITALGGVSCAAPKRDFLLNDSLDAVAAVVAADALAFALECSVSELTSREGAVKLAVEQIALAIHGRGVAVGNQPDRCPKFSVHFVTFAEEVALKVSSWGYSPIEVLPLAAQILYAGEGNFSVSDIAASLEAAAI